MRRMRWIMAALLVPALMLGWAAIALAQSTPSASEGQEPTVYVRQDPTLDLDGFFCDRPRRPEGTAMRM